DLMTSVADTFKDGGKKFFAVNQEFDVVAVVPSVFHKNCASLRCICAWGIGFPVALPLSAEVARHVDACWQSAGAVASNAGGSSVSRSARLARRRCHFFARTSSTR